MQITSDGKTQLSTKGELYYHLLLEMGLALDKLNHLYDQNTGDTLAWKDKYIKCSVDDQPIYAGKDEIIFSLDENFQLFMNLYAHFLDTLAADPDNNIVVVSYYIDYDENLNKSKLSIKYNTKDGSITNGLIVTSYSY